jgi:succinate-acetate transporter protein
MSTITDKSGLARDPLDRPVAAERPVIADPAALGLGAFALTTFLLSLANSGLLPGAGAAVLGIALFYGGIAQVAAGLWEFAKGNTFGATAFVSYGAFWLSFWWLETNPAVAKEAGAAGVGAFLLAWTIFTLFMTVAAVKTNGALLAVFIVLTLTFAALTIGEFSGQVGITRLGGWLGLLTAALAWYSAFAVVINATWKRAVLPVWPR